MNSPRRESPPVFCEHCHREMKAASHEITSRPSVPALRAGLRPPPALTMAVWRCEHCGTKIPRTR